jgi:hypothetical protein
MSFIGGVPFNLTPSNAASSAVNGNGAKFQLFTGAAPGTGTLPKFDANGNVIASGMPIGNVPEVGTCAVTASSGAITYTDSVAAPCSIFTYSLSSGSVSSGTLSGLQTGKYYTFQITGDGTHTFVWPTTVIQPPAVVLDASATTAYTCYFDGTNCDPQTGTSAAYSEGPVQSQPSANPPSGYFKIWFDNTSGYNRIKGLDSAGNVTGLVRDASAVTAEFVTGIVNGVPAQGHIYSGSQPTTNDCAKFDVNGLVTDAGAACGSGGGGMTYPSGTGLAVVSSGTSWGTTVLLGTLTNGDYCTYTTASGINCTSTGSGSMTYPSGSGVVIVSGGSSWGSTLTAPSGTIVGTSDTQTLTNKRITSRVQTCATSGANACVLTGSAGSYVITPDSDNADEVYYNDSGDSAGATLTIGADGGSPTENQVFLIKLKTTNSLVLSWTMTVASGVDSSCPTTTTGSSKTDIIALRYDALAGTRWLCTGLQRGY